VPSWVVQAGLLLLLDVADEPVVEWLVQLAVKIIDAARAPPASHPRATIRSTVFDAPSLTR
jgi:hypothetical protein